MSKLFILLLFGFGGFQSTASICDHSNPRYLLRGDLTAKGKGARLWSLENLEQDLRANPDDACVKETFEKAYSEQKEYWDDVKARSGCPGTSQLRVSCEEIELNLNFAESMNAAKERALGMPAPTHPGGCSACRRSRSPPVPTSKPSSPDKAKDPVRACREALDKRFFPGHGYNLSSNPSFDSLSTNIGGGAVSCLQGLGDGIIRTVGSTVDAAKGAAIGIFGRVRDFMGYLLYRADAALNLSGNFNNVKSAPVPVTETLLAQDIHAIVNFEFQDPETGTTYTGPEAMARAVTYGITTYLKDSGTIYTCLDSASQSRFLCDAIAGVGTSFVGIRAIAQFGSRSASWTRAGSRGAKPEVPSELASRIPKVEFQAPEGDFIPGERAKQLPQQSPKVTAPRSGVLSLPRSAGSGESFNPVSSSTIQPAAAQVLARSAKTDASNPRHLASLERNNLLPKTTIEVASTKYHLSDIVEMNGRKVVFAIVEKNGVRTTQTFYTSNSQGTFRNLPGLFTENGRVIWYDKGPGEGALELPAQVEAELANRIAVGQVRRDLDDGTVKELFDGSVRKFSIDRGMLDPEYISQTRSSPAHQVRVERIVTPTLETGLKDLNHRPFTPPSQIRFTDPSDSPNFSREPTLRYTTQTSTAGRVEAEVYPSANGKYQFTIFRDSENKIWVAKAENLHADITETGLRARAPDVGELTMSRWEYGSQVPIPYMGKINPLNDSYVDSWSYLREIPVIQSYYRSKGMEIP